jgi:glycerophosphoryl diester phosphodiesterase
VIFLSSTNRSKARDNHIADYYITPISDIKVFLESFRKIDNMDYDKYKILDSCAGGDEINPMSYPEALKDFTTNEIETIDIREDSRANVVGDYLNIKCDNMYDMIITNPPFKISIDVLKKALDDVKTGGYVIMLLRLNYLESASRKKFWEDNMCKYIFLHHKRMSFTQDGKSDSVCHAHFVWQKGYKKNHCKTFII